MSSAVPGRARVSPTLGGGNGVQRQKFALVLGYFTAVVVPVVLNLAGSFRRAVKDDILALADSRQTRRIFRDVCPVGLSVDSSRIADP